MAEISSLFDLSGKAAIVTGGSRGLGAEIAEGLAEAGAAVFLLARRDRWLGPTVEAMKSRGFRCEGAICDVSEKDQVEDAVGKAMEAFGAVDILVNNAGITWGAEPEKMPLDRWRAVLDVNLTGAFLCAQTVGRAMIQRRAGNIINVASIAGLTGTGTLGNSIAGYAASKAGLLGMTRELASRWGRLGIRVNALAPGYFPTRMTETILEEVEQAYRETAPLGRAGRPGELKGAAVFLASDASSYVTGQTIIVDGGATIV